MEHKDDILTEAAEVLADVVTDAADAAAEVAEPVVEAAKKTAKRTKAAAKTATKRGRKAVEDAAKSAESTVKAVRAAVKPELFVQVDFNEVEISDVVEKSKADFRAKNGRVAVKICKVYVKPLERAAYYVINGDVTGKIDL